ncbi:MAG: hypothetical protein ACR2MX_14810 [Cyclobacteriaceae bacterium]
MSQIQTTVEHIETFPVSGNQLLIGRKLPPSGVKGNYFLQDHWAAGDIVLHYGPVLENYPLRYDIENDILEIKLEKEGQVKILKGEKVSKFLLHELAQTREFINASEYKFQGTVHIGFFEIIQDGNTQLFSKTFAKVKPPTYVEGLDVGERDHKIIKHEKIYIARDGEAFELGPFGNDNKKHFETHLKSVEKYAKENRLKFKGKEDLKQIVAYYNKLNSSNQ